MKNLFDFDFTVNESQPVCLNSDVENFIDDFEQNADNLPVIVVSGYRRGYMEDFPNIKEESQEFEIVPRMSYQDWLYQISEEFESFWIKSCRNCNVFDAFDILYSEFSYLKIQNEMNPF